MEIGPLTSNECSQVEQMLTSSQVRIPWGIFSSLDETDFYVLTQIMITDFTSELSDTDEKMSKIKITWRFMDNCPKAQLKSSPGIFNDSYNPVFS